MHGFVAMMSVDKREENLIQIKKRNQIFILPQCGPAFEEQLHLESLLLYSSFLSHRFQSKESPTILKKDFE
jgi:hypothetical protein